MTYNVAQVNIGKFKFPIDDPRMADFKNNLDKINKLAENSEGFVWQLKDDDGGAASSIVAFDDPLLAINMSVWKSVKDLKSYVYRTEHVEFFSRRSEWFQKYDGEHLALWWIKEGHIPSIEEAKMKLQLIEREGQSEAVFGFGKTYPKPAK